MNNFSFNGIQKPFLQIVEKERPYWVELERSISEVPGKFGGKLKNTEIGPIEISITVRVEAKSRQDLQDKVEEMATWLVTEDPKRLVFDDMPDRAYYAVLDGETIPDKEIVSFSVVKLNFICPDPYKYGKEKQAVRIKKLTWEDYKGQTWKEVAADGD